MDTAKPKNDGLNFTELLQIVKLRRKLLYLLMFTSVLGVLVRQILYVPQFTAQTTLSIQKIENSPMQLALANLGTMPIDTSDRLKKYIDYLHSHEFFLAVAETLKFKDGYKLLNLNSPAEISLTSKKFWGHFLANNFGRKAPPRADQPEPELVPVEKLAWFLQSVTAADASGADMVRVKVTTLDPFTSMVLANTATEVFVKKTSERDYNEVAEVKRFIEQQLESTTERLKRSESALVDFKRHNNIISIGVEHSAFANKLSTIENELETSRIKTQENQKLIRYYEKVLAQKESQLLKTGSAAVTASDQDLIARVRMQLDTLQQRKVLMQAQGFVEGSWQLAEINREIDQAAALLKQKLAASGASDVAGPFGHEDGAQDPLTTRSKLAALQSENKGLEAKVDSLEKSRQNLLRGLEGLPKEEQILLNLTKDLDLQFELFSMLKKKLQEVEIQQVALQSRVQINERSAMGAPAPRTSFIVKTLFALLVSSFLGCTIAFLLEALDPTVKHLIDLDRMEIQALGSIPRIPGSEVRQSLGARTYRPDLLICKEKPESGESMAFKYIRAQIGRMRAPDGSPSKIITVTSPERGDGKSLCSANVAVSLSQLEKRTLLIDCDFRNPSIPWYFGYKEGNGLTSLLTLKCSLDEVLMKDRLPCLDILPAGWALPNPTELVSNDKFRLLLEHLRMDYDYIVIDAPPAIAVVDASVIANSSDSVLLVTGFRKTKKANAMLALRKILAVTHKHVYGVLNGVGEIHEYSTYAAQPSAAAMGDEAPDAKSELAKFARVLTSKKAG